MHSVLKVPEILGNIFEHSEEQSNASSMSVCREWFEICRPVLWYSVVTPRQFGGLLTLLGPVSRRSENYNNGNVSSLFTFYPQLISFLIMHCKTKQSLVYDRLPLRRDWNRFYLYSNCVRVMILSRVVEHDRALRVIAETRPTEALMPNLRTLHCTSKDQVYFGSMFMHPRIRTLIIDIQIQKASGRTTQLIDSISRIPHLVSLTVTSKFDISQGMEILGEISSLECVALPRFHVGQIVIAGFSRFKRLKTLKEIRTTTPGALNPTREPTGFLPRLEKDAYPSLEEFGFSADAPSSITFIEQEFFPAQIRKLELDMVSSQLPDVVQKLFMCVASRCPGLEEFFFSDIASDPIHPNAQHLSGDVLRPLFSIRGLLSLSIHHSRRLHITSEDIQDLASAFPAIQVLHLNPSPEYYSAEIPPLNLSVLNSLARQCPNLKALSLSVCGNTVPNLDKHDVMDIAAFKSLKDLSFGNSVPPGENIGPISLFLLQVLPSKCSITGADLSWNDVSEQLQILLPMKKFEEMKMEERIRRLEIELASANSQCLKLEGNIYSNFS